MLNADNYDSIKDLLKKLILSNKNHQKFMDRLV